MNSYVKTHDQLAQVSGVGVPVSGVSFEVQHPRVLKQVKSLHIQRNLLKANKSSQKFIGLQNTETDDPFGGVLRKLRIQQGLDPSVVASNACITVWQLYELETGQDTLFYTPGLRTRAAERVAAFLNSDWNDICQGRFMVRVLQEVPVQLHLVGSRRIARRVINPAEVVVEKVAPEAVNTTDTDDTFLSLAPLLRVADASDGSAP